MDDNPHWKDLIKVKSGLDKGGWFSMEPRGVLGWGLWKDILKEAQQLNQDCNLILGNEERIRF